MTFTVNQKVVCIAVWHSPQLVKGKIYTVTGVLMRPHWTTPGLLLAEIAPLAGYVAFESLQFRPIVENKSSVSFTMGADPESERWDGRRKKARERA